MKNKLWVFGCSLSTGMNGGGFYENEIIFPFILADKLGLECINSSKPARCNWTSILHFLDNKDEIKKGDVILFQFTFYDRYCVFPLTAQLSDLKSYIKDIHNGSVDGVSGLIKDYIFNWFVKHILNYCKTNNIELYCWSVEGQTHDEFNRYNELIDFIPAPNSTATKPNYSFYTKWQSEASDQHIIEPNGNIDKHFNELGHQRMANHFFEYINTYRKSLL